MGKDQGKFDPPSDEPGSEVGASPSWDQSRVLGVPWRWKLYYDFTPSEHSAFFDAHVNGKYKGKYKIILSRVDKANTVRQNKDKQLYIDGPSVPDAYSIDMQSTTAAGGWTMRAVDLVRVLAGMSSESPVQTFKDPATLEQLVTRVGFNDDAEVLRGWFRRELRAYDPWVGKGYSGNYRTMYAMVHNGAIAGGTALAFRRYSKPKQVKSRPAASGGNIPKPDDLGLVDGDGGLQPIGHGSGPATPDLESDSAEKRASESSKRDAAAPPSDEEVAVVLLFNYDIHPGQDPFDPTRMLSGALNFQPEGEALNQLINELARHGGLPEWDLFPHVGLPPAAPKEGS